MKNNLLNFNSLAFQKMNSIRYLTTQKLGKIKTINNNNKIMDLQRVCSPQVRGLTDNFSRILVLSDLFPASTGINRVHKIEYTK